MISTFSRKIGKSVAIKFFSFLSLAILILTLVGIFQTPVVNAQETIVDLKPGETKTFTVTYKNQGDEPLLTQGQLQIFIGKELILDTSSLKDNFNNSGEFAVSPSLVSTTNPVWGSVINYLPKSANNPSTPSGTAGPADVTVPLNESGVFTFKATLKSDVLTRFKVGDVINPTNNNQGVRGRLVSTGFGSVPGEIGIRLLAPDACSNGATNPPTCTCATGQKEVNGRCTDIIDIDNIGSCTPAGQNITIGQTASCKFPLSQGTTGNNFVLPDNGITGSIATATGTSPACTIIGNGTAEVALQCNAIPSTGATAGLRDVLIKVESGTPTAKGNVNLTNAETCPSGATGTFPNCVCSGGQTYDNSKNSCACPANQSLVNGTCTSCPSGATGTFPSCVCPNGQTYNKDNNICVTSSCTNGATNPPACDQFPNIAKPDADNIDNDNVGGDNEPEFISITFNPNPGKINQPITVTTTGLVNFFSNKPYNGPCTTFLTGNGFTFSNATTAVNGVCTVNFSSNEVPKIAGNYVAYTVVPGPDNQTLTTPSAPIQFIGNVFVTPRTGGEWQTTGILVIAIGLLLGSVAIFMSGKKRKLEVDN